MSSKKEKTELLTQVEIDYSVATAEPSFGEGVSGAFGGAIGEWLVLGGGCNFPASNPAVKQFYSTLLATRQVTYGAWETIQLPPLQVPVGYGATLVADDGRTLYLVGGTDGTNARSEIYQVQLHEGKPQVQLHSVALPFGWYEGAAALNGTHLYIIGGWRAGGVPLQEVVRVSLTDGSHQVVATLPDGARIQPVGFVQDTHLYIYGGFCPASGSAAPYMHAKAYALPLTGGQAEWQVVSEYPRLEEGGRKLLFVGTAVARCPKGGEVYAVGGVNWNIFESAVVREYNEAKARQEGQGPEVMNKYAQARQDYLAMTEEEFGFMPHVIRFCPKSREWLVVATNSAYATAGAALAVTEGGELYVVGGERKPRVRTPHVWQLTLGK